MDGWMYHVTWARASLPPNSIDSSVFAQLTRVPTTDSHLRATCDIVGNDDAAKSIRNVNVHYTVEDKCGLIECTNPARF